MNRHISRTALAFVVVVPAVISGCNGMTPLVERRVMIEVPAAPSSPLLVESANGSVAATEHDRDTILINATIRARSQARADATDVRAEVGSDGGVRVYAHWPERRGHNEGCSFDVQVPGCSSIDLRTSNGGITLRGLSGSASLTTSNGGISVDGFSGPITAMSSNGAIRITHATAAVDARTSNGTLAIVLAASSPGPVRLQTSNGPVDLGVGEGFRGELRAVTSNGAVNFHVPGVAVEQPSKTIATATFGAGAGGSDGSSSIQTSNGRVTIRRAE